MFDRPKCRFTRASALGTVLALATLGPNPSSAADRPVLTLTAAESGAGGTEFYRVGSGGDIICADPVLHTLNIYIRDGLQRRSLGTEKDPLFSDIGDFFQSERGEVTFANNHLGGLVTLDPHGAVKKVWSPMEKASVCRMDLVEPIPGGGLLIGDEPSAMLFLFNDRRELVERLPWDTNGFAIDSSATVFLLRDHDGQAFIESRDATGKHQIHGYLPRQQSETHWFVHGVYGHGILVATELCPALNRATLCWLSLAGDVLHRRPVPVLANTRAIQVARDGTVHMLLPPPEPGSGGAQTLMCLTPWAH